jgi:carbonic anhydrase/acetyltransferase-like protein (isoleucine patch superfamily)
MSATVMDGAHIERGVIVAARAVVLQGARLEAGYLYTGIPAKKIKPAGNLAEVIRRTAENYPNYASWFEGK